MHSAYVLSKGAKWDSSSVRLHGGSLVVQSTPNEHVLKYTGIECQVGSSQFEI